MTLDRVGTHQGLIEIKQLKAEIIFKENKINALHAKLVQCVEKK